MEEKIKEIISVFLKTTPDLIKTDTLIDRSAIGSSIMIHRMYSNLAELGVIVDRYTEIKTFGNLMHRVGKIDQREIPLNEVFTPSKFPNSVISREAENGIGVDMEEIGSLPHSGDFREEKFYKMNFCAQEIAYCILQDNAYASFAGLFAAKEAIVKAAPEYRHQEFNSICIDHLSDGKPFFSGFQISISHTKDYAIAVAVKGISPVYINEPKSENILIQPAGLISSTNFWIGILSLLISIAALIFVLRH